MKKSTKKTKKSKRSKSVRKSIVIRSRVNQRSKKQEIKPVGRRNSSLVSNSQAKFSSVSNLEIEEPLELGQKISFGRG
jgi:hypothetical protein